MAFIVVVLIIVSLVLAPVIGLASINTIMEQAGVALYVPHNLWTYLSVWGLAMVFRGGK